MNELSNADIFWSGVVVGAVVMAALVTLAQTVAEEMVRIQSRGRYIRRSALPRVRW